MTADNKIATHFWLATAHPASMEDLELVQQMSRNDATNQSVEVSHKTCKV